MCIGGHHVTYIEEPDKVAPCACGAAASILRSVVTGGRPRYFWLIQREPLHVGRPRKQAAQ